MPMPMWVAEINKRFFNKIELRKGERPVLHHVGRSSGTAYHTPLEVHRVDGGFVVALMYGPKSDWVRNLLAGGSAELEIDGEHHKLTNPRIIAKEEALQLLPAAVKPPPDFLNVNQYFQIDQAA